MIRILCTGDSHTWGQGVAGLEKEVDPPWVGGELRLTSFRSDHYVNLLRKKINEATGSYAWEWTAQELAEIESVEFEVPCAVIGPEGMEIFIVGAMIRMEFAMSQEMSEAEIRVDGESMGVWNLQTDKKVNAWKLITLHLAEGRHALSIRAATGRVGVYRIETYAGACAVINSGIGSCPVGRMRTDFVKDYVEAVRPDVVLMEAHTINDWLTGETPEEYCNHLIEFIEDIRRIGAEPVLMTVAPIGGEQIRPGLAAVYDEFVEASRRAAYLSGIRLCDANTMMKILAEGLTETEMSRYLLSDNWHPNNRGHAIYAQMLYEAISSEKWIREMGENRDENR